uniref:Uncharacterized protein n=1 Tax=Candidatus Kentrum eta TaxID=2126337 RepID=A0A450V3F7_9GAMM|nr:MAG: hypothetical protein BECKH772A_GA0070896_101546 [Candidatus Kentron sp. H]VFJ99285.1 MAG: hypothetical protein BECKH772B_GA0070898_101553 [Candidatus Kentron sp. H]
MDRTKTAMAAVSTAPSHLLPIQPSFRERANRPIAADRARNTTDTAGMAAIAAKDTASIVQVKPETAVLSGLAGEGSVAGGGSARRAGWGISVGMGFSMGISVMRRGSAYTIRACLRSCLEIRNLPRRRPNCALPRCDGGEVRYVLGRRVVHYNPYFRSHRALREPQSGHRLYDANFQTAS